MSRDAATTRLERVGRSEILFGSLSTRLGSPILRCVGEFAARVCALYFGARPWCSEPTERFRPVFANATATRGSLRRRRRRRRPITVALFWGNWNRGLFFVSYGRQSEHWGRSKVDV